jgi:hypothetical protein
VTSGSLFLCYNNSHTARTLRTHTVCSLTQLCVRMCMYARCVKAEMLQNTMYNDIANTLVYLCCACYIAQRVVLVWRCPSPQWIVFLCSRLRRGNSLTLHAVCQPGPALRGVYLCVQINDQSVGRFTFERRVTLSLHIGSAFYIVYVSFMQV